MSVIDEHREQAEVTERLATALPAVPTATVREVVAAAWSEFTGKPVRDFVPVLAERAARDSLRQYPVAAG
jgi:hypothetical protein